MCNPAFLWQRGVRGNKYTFYSNHDDAIARKKIRITDALLCSKLEQAAEHEQAVSCRGLRRHVAHVTVMKAQIHN